MKFLLQILFFLLVWFTNQVKATPVFTKIVLPINTILFSQKENVEQQSEVKIGLKNFARNSIEENIYASKNTLRERHVLEYSVSFKHEEVVSGAGNWVTQRTSFWDDWINKCFPSKNWSNTTFVTKGKNYSTFKTTNASVYNDMKALNPNEIKLQEFIEAGSIVPVKVSINNGDEFFNIVPKCNNIGSPSAYYVDQAQLNLIKANPEKLEQVLGLPLGSVNAEYDVFKITYQSSNGYVFKSTVAGTEQFANATPTLKYLTPGGGTQTLILDNMDGAKWLKGSAPIESIARNKLPLIGN